MNQTRYFAQCVMKGQSLMKANETFRFSSWAIASAFSSLDPQFVADNSIDNSRLFVVPSSDPPDPNDVLPAHLIKWPSLR